MLLACGAAAAPRQPAPRGAARRPDLNVGPAAKPARAASVVAVTLDEFNARHAKDYPRSSNLARGGSATASSTHERMDEPFTALGGGRVHETWALKGGSGWFEATWPDRLAARHVLVFNRPPGSDGDAWDAASIEINGEPVATLPPSPRGHVYLVDLGHAADVRSLKLWVQGSNNPGVSGLELHAPRGRND